MAAAADSVEPVYKFYKKDFKPLVTKPIHFDLEFDIRENAVRVTATCTLVHTGAEPLRTLQLNSKDLAIEKVELLEGCSALPLPKPNSSDFVSHVASFAGAKAQSLKFDVDSAEHFLNVHFEAPIAEGQQFTLRTVSVATPTAHILEGLYYDWTPQGAPRTIITQVGHANESQRHLE